MVGFGEIFGQLHSPFALSHSPVLLSRLLAKTHGCFVVHTKNETCNTKN